VRARKCHKDSVSFTMTSTFWIDTNHRPQIQEQTHAAWRRVKLIPFDATIQPGRKDKHLKGRILRNESSGILNWLIEGARKWSKAGLGAPPEVQAAVEEYRVTSSSVASWRATSCRVDHGLMDRSSTLQQSYEAYCRTEGIEPVSGRDFKILMVELGHERQRRSSGVYYHGIATCGPEEGSDPDA
jgi:putative DNA primase/helicase